ncbi:hypothetical protein BS78_05G271300 [Paspalum vaginatum]|nr:hypothetical protein BS78_05G271300 [Paspalum vaginatum]
MFKYSLQGETIRATIWKNQIGKYKPKITEGSIYALSNFKVQEDTKYRPVKNTLKIVFIYNTNVKEVEEDVIGLLTKIKQVETRTILKNMANPRQKDIREIELLILKDQSVRITLWGDLAHSLNEDVIGKHTVIIVTSTMVEGLQGMISLKITNGTRIYTDLDIPETWKFIDSVPYKENFPKMMEVNKSTQGTLEDQMFYNRRTLKDITQTRHDNPTQQDFVFTSRATIDRLANTTWWYMVCNVCNKMCTKIVSKYHCSKCNKCPEATTPRYLIRLHISDHTATTTCSIFYDEAQRMLKTTMTNLLDSLNGKSEEIPKVILELYGKTLIFRFKLNDQNLTDGKEYYLVKRTFEPDDKLEFKHLGAESKEEEIIEDPISINPHLQVNAGRQLEDSDEANNDKFPLSKKANKRKRRAYTTMNDSDEDCNKNFFIKEADIKSRKRVRGAVEGEAVEDHRALKRSMKKMRRTTTNVKSSAQGEQNINIEELIHPESNNTTNNVPEEVNAENINQLGDPSVDYTETDQQSIGVLSKMNDKTKRMKRAYRKKKREDVIAERQDNINGIPEETNMERNIDTDGTNADICITPVERNAEIGSNIESNSIPAMDDSNEDCNKKLFKKEANTKSRKRVQSAVEGEAVENHRALKRAYMKKKKVSAASKEPKRSKSKMTEIPFNQEQQNNTVGEEVITERQ